MEREEQLLGTPKSLLFLLRSFFFSVFPLFYLAFVFYSFLPSLVLLPSMSLPSLLFQNFCPHRFVPLFSFPSSKPSSPFFLLLHFPCIYRQPGERHHTLSKCRAWWRGMAPVQPLQGMAFFSSWWRAYVSYFSINEGVWLCKCRHGSCGIFGQVGRREKARRMT